MTMAWTPEREGNWLFHCHIMASRVARATPVRPPRSRRHIHADHQPGRHVAMTHHAATTIRRHGRHGARRHGPRARRATTRTPSDAADGPRQLTLDDSTRPPARAAGPPPASSSPRRRRRSAGASPPGPPLVLRRDEPVEITVVNHLAESDLDALARPRARQLLRRRARLERQRSTVAPMIEPGGASSSASRRRAPARSSITRTCTTTGSCRRASTVR